MKFDETGFIKNVDRFRKDAHVSSTERSHTEFEFQPYLDEAVEQRQSRGHDKRSAFSAEGYEQPQSDQTDLQGLNVEDLEQDVRQRLQRMLEELGRTKDQLALAKGRIAYLERELDEDSRFSIYKERRFLSEINHLRQLDDTNQLKSSLVLLVWRDFLKMRAKNGREAAYEQMIEIVQFLKNTLHTGDLIGRLGDNIVGLLSIAEHPQDAIDRLERHFQEGGPSINSLFITIHAEELSDLSAQDQIDYAEKKLLQKMIDG